MSLEASHALAVQHNPSFSSMNSSQSEWLEALTPGPLALLPVTARRMPFPIAYGTGLPASVNTRHMYVPAAWESSVLLKVGLLWEQVRHRLHAGKLWYSALTSGN